MLSVSWRWSRRISRASFRILDWMSVWVRGENLLNQRYEINAGFPMPGANVIGGLNFEF